MDGHEIARRFALAGAARLSDGPVARGKQGVVWRLDTADGAWAVKVPLAFCTEDDVRSSAAFQEAAHRAGVPTPQPRRTSEGCVFAQVDGTLLRMYEWIDLAAPDRSLDPSQVGTVVAAIHTVGAAESLPGESGSVEPWYCEPVGADRWDDLVRQLLACGAPFARQLAALRDELVALESWLEPPEVLRICHRDLWSDNVLPTPSGGVCVLDWENSGPADQSHELACVLFEYAPGDAGRARALVRAYQDAGGPARVSRRGHFSMLVAQLGHITEIAASDWLHPNPRSPDRASSASWIGEVLDDPHTRARLQALLDAVTPPRLH